ncbi:unnamed protein product [Calicophoron daubneyi]|uniref:D domain-containing protein n=1 Tax=Calicophoron daubneyi TaxID=300641 RepID=A0AAV2SYU1_CALDB
MYSDLSHRELCSDRGCESCRDISENVHSTYISNIKRAKPPDNMTVDQKKKRLHNASGCTSLEKKTCIDMFETWSSSEQVDFLCHVLSRMSHFQQSQVNDLLEPLLKRNFIVAFRSHGVPHLAELILTQLDALSLLSAELVSRDWQWSVAKYQLWRRLIAQRIATDPVWHGLAERRGWLELVNLTDPSQLPASMERRRIAMGSRQKLTEFPLLTDSTCGPDPVHSSNDRKAIQPYNPLTSSLCHCHIGGNNSGASPFRPALNSVEFAACSSTQPGSGRELLIDGASASSSTLHSSFVYPASRHAHTSSSFTESEMSDSASTEAVMFAHRFYKQLYPRIIKDIKRVEDNWARGKYHLTRIPCRSDVTKGVYCLQYDKEKIVSGLRDDTIKVWRRFDPNSSQPNRLRHSAASRPVVIHREGGAASSQHNEDEASVDGARHIEGGAEGMVAPDGRAAPEAAGEAGSNDGLVADAGADGYRCTQVLEGHSGSVLCLQYIGNLLISGSSDTTVRLWDLSTGRCLNIICHHAEAVLHLRFRNNVLVTCSKDRSIAVWDMGPWPKDVQLRQVLVGHRAAVNVVDFDDKYIVSASGDRTIKVWATDTCAYVRTLTGHRRGIACLQYRDRLVVSGSSDNTIRIWDIETGVCFRVLEGHEELVRCIRFDSKRIVSGAYDGKIKVWNLKAALNPRSNPSQLCIHTLQQHTGRVFRLQFDDFQIVSSSHDDTILIWDFVRPSAGSDERDDGYDDGLNTMFTSQGNCACLPSTSQPAPTGAAAVNPSAAGPSGPPSVDPSKPKDSPVRSQPSKASTSLPFASSMVRSSNDLPRSTTNCIEMESELLAEASTLPSTFRPLVPGPTINQSARSAAANSTANRHPRRSAAENIPSNQTNPAGPPRNLYSNS